MKRIFLLPVIIFIGLFSCNKPGINDPTASTKPILTTTAISMVTVSTAQAGGNITSDGGVPVTARGVCWSTTSNPTIANSKTTDGSGTGSFTSSLTVLTASTTYYVRAFATNSVGTAYGNEISFTTLAATAIPTITTTAISIVTQTTAQSGGNITSDGGASITARGICWSATTGPTTANSKTTEGSGVGSFTSFLTGMAASTIYYVRAYATNSAGTAYGSEIIFTTLPASANTVIDIDGNVYNTITIGTQVWMSENLKTTHYQNGFVIPTGLSDGNWGTTTSGASAIYNNDAANNITYGKLYNWYAAIDSRKIAPQGWHVPTKAEWLTLINTLGGFDMAGGKMKETGLTHWNTPNSGATNSSAFTGLPAGNRINTGAYNYIGNGGYWWSTTEDSPGSADAEAIGLFFNLSEAAQISGSKNYGLSVRCIKD